MTKNRGTTPRILRFEGHEYHILPEPVRPGILRAVRPGDKPSDPAVLTEWRARTPNSEVNFAESDLRDSGEGWWYLPCRVGPPLSGDYLEGPDGTPGKWLIPPHPLRDAIRAHPAYAAGRDDIARARLEDALNN